MAIIGIDTNILCYAMDPAYPENKICKKYLTELSSNKQIALNPTVVHETYHVLVYGQKWEPHEARTRLSAIIAHPYTAFFNQTRTTCSIGLRIAVDNNLGGRDSLILASLVTNKISEFHTHDEELKNLGTVSWKKTTLKITDPLER
nr:type II toxin-antitoxin system VapC family toxin [Candidatus Njordarchaeota archaeon]